jgi:hypothetical protein
MGDDMKNNQQATHNHKRAGAVVVLQSTAELARVLVPGSGDEFWVKLIDLTELGAVVEKPKAGKKAVGKQNAGTAPNTRYRVARVA